MGSTAGISISRWRGFNATKAAVKMLSDGIWMDTIVTDIKSATIQPGIVDSI